MTAGGVNGPPVTSGGAYVYPSRTLAQLRSSVLARLGYVDLITGAPTRTLATIRASVINALGIPDAITGASTKTLLQLRDLVAQRAGYGMNVTPPTGFNTMLNGFINEAQQTLFRRLELDQGGSSYPAQMTVDADVTTLDYNLVFNLATALYKAHEGQPDAKAYFDTVERLLADHAARRPPNLEESVNDFIIEAQQTVYRRYEMGTTTFALAAFAADGDSTTIDYRPVQALATADAKAWMKQPDAKRYYDEVEQYFRDLERRMPANIRTTVAQCLKDAQETLVVRYPVLKNHKWWSWAVVAGSRIYDVPKSGTDALDMRRVYGAWIEDNNTWLPLKFGIDPRQYSSDDSSGMPTNIVLHEFIELYPKPDKSYTLWLRGDFALRAFSADGDSNTLDYHAVYLYTLHAVLDAMNRPGADNAKRELERYIGDLVYADHANRRYIPNPRRACDTGAPGGGVEYGSGVIVDESGIVIGTE